MSAERNAPTTGSGGSSAAVIRYVEIPRESWQREGEREYEVLRDGVKIGTVNRFRERYPYKSLGGNVAMFRSRWSWRNDVSRISFDTRKEAVARLLEEADRADA